MNKVHGVYNIMCRYIVILVIGVFFWNTPAVLASDPRTYTKTTLVSSGINLNPVVAVNTDNLPVIAYYDEVADTVNVLRCSNAKCTEFTNIVLTDTHVEGTDSNIVFLDFVLDNDIPVIALTNFASNDIVLVRCTDTTCTSATTTTLGQFSSALSYISVTMSNFGPVIAYSDASGLMYIHCDDDTCINFDEPVNLDNNKAIAYVSMAMLDNKPLVAYQAKTGDNTTELRTVQCAQGLACTDSVKTVIDNSTSEAGYFAAATVNKRSPYGVMSYVNVNSKHDQDELKVAKCLNQGCSQFVITTVHHAKNINNSFIALRANGKPIVTFQQGHRFKVAYCKTKTCSVRSLDTIYDQGETVAQYHSVAVNRHAKLIFAYTSKPEDLEQEQQLKFAIGK